VGAFIAVAGTLIEVSSRVMKTISALALLSISWSGACASSNHLEATLDETSLAIQTIHDADGAGAGNCEKAADLVARAKAAVAYAQHLPGDPDHARRLYMSAQVDAELALLLTRRDAHAQRMALVDAHHATAVSAVTP
jgi:hypothetical protein